MKRFCLIFIVVLFSSAVAVANDNLQNLQKKLNTTEQIDQKLELYWKIYKETFGKDNDLSYRYALEYNKLAMLSTSLDHKSNSYWALARLNRLQGKLDNSFENYLQTIHWSRLAGLKERVGYCLKNIGNIFQNVGEFDKAYQYYFDALNIYEELNLKPEVINAYRSISICKRKEGNFNDASKYAQRALRQAKHSKNDKYINSIYNLIGVNSYVIKDYKQAREMYIQSIENIDSLKDKIEVLAMAYNNIGETYREEGDLKNAHKYFYKALTEKRKLDNPRLTASTLLNIGKLHLMENNYLEAINALGEAISNLNPNIIDENLIEAIKESTIAYELAKSEGLNVELRPMIAYNKILSQQFGLTQQMRKELVKQHNQYMLDNSFEKQALQANIGQLQNTKLYLIWAGVLIIVVFLVLIFLMNRALKKAQRKSQEIVQTLNQMKGVLGKSFQRMLDDDTFTITTKKNS